MVSVPEPEWDTFAGVTSCCGYQTHIGLFTYVPIRFREDDGCTESMDGFESLHGGSAYVDFDMRHPIPKVIDTSLVAPPQTTNYPRLVDDVRNLEFVMTRAGWPFLCFREIRIYTRTEHRERASPIESRYRPEASIPGLVLPPSWVEPLKWDNKRYDFAIPVRPLFPEFLYSVAFWSMAALTCFHAARRFRRFVRGHASLPCPSCNYDLQGNPSAGCPECGWNRFEHRPIGDVTSDSPRHLAPDG